LDALDWANRIGGLRTLIARSEANLAVIAEWLTSEWAAFLATEATTRSSTSICLKIIDPWFKDQDSARQSTLIKQIVALLEGEHVAYDIGSYRDAPSGLRIWGGATVETDDIKKLLPWLDWAYQRIKAG